jgi:hypothetical protein
MYIYYVERIGFGLCEGLKIMSMSERKVVSNLPEGSFK